MKYHNNEYTIVTEPPLGYEIWNIKDAPNGCLPFCRLKMMQPFGGARKIEPDTLKAMKCDGAQVILDAIGFGPQTSDAMQKYIAKKREERKRKVDLRTYEKSYPFYEENWSLRSWSNATAKVVSTIRTAMGLTVFDMVRSFCDSAISRLPLSA